MGTAEYRHAQAPPGCRLSVVAPVALARCGTHFVALRVYIGCYFVKWPPVAALKLRLVSSTALRPGGFTKPTLCKVPPLGTVAQPSALPGRVRALRAAVWLPCGCRGTWALVRRFAQGFGQWPAASNIVCAPPTLGPRRFAALALRWSARPPPRGSLSPALPHPKSCGPRGAAKAKARNKSGLLP